MEKLEAIIAQIDTVLGEYDGLTKRNSNESLWDWDTVSVTQIVGRLGSTLDRFAPRGSYHRKNYEYVLNSGHGWEAVKPLVGGLQALRQEYLSGYLDSVEQLLHAESYSSFLDMASELQASGYKDAAAVIAGSVLEQHLRALCTKNDIEVLINEKYKKAETLNTELARDSIYSKLDQKSVTSWLGLRNDAAHGNYDSYSQQQVRLMIDSIGDFLTRNPA